MLALVSGGCLGCSRQDNIVRVPDKEKGRFSKTSASMENKPRAPVATKTIQELQERVDRVTRTILALESGRPLPPAWVRSHMLLAYGPNAYAERNSADGSERILNSFLGSVAGLNVEIPFVLRGDQLHPRNIGAAVDQQGHANQFLAYLSMAGVPLDAQVLVGKRALTVQQLVDSSLYEIHRDTDLSWTVIAYAAYLQPEQTWDTKFGERLCFFDVVQWLLDKPEVACDGAHFLCAAAMVLAQPQWKVRLTTTQRYRCERIIDEKVTVIRDSGLWSSEDLSEFVSDRPTAGVMQSRGHALEWITNRLGADQLCESWIVDAVEQLLDAIELEHEFLFANEIAYSKKPAGYGSLGHAMSGLRRWSKKVNSIDIGLPSKI